MDIYQASDGGLYQLERYIEEYDSIDALYLDVCQITGVADHNVLLFMEDGRELKSDVLMELWSQAGPSYGGSQVPPRTKLYLYNRETFWSDAEHWASLFREEVQLPPPLDLSSLADIQSPFLVAHDHLLHLQSLYESQSAALQIAYANLQQHLRPLIDEWESFSGRVEDSFQAEEQVIKSAKLDMALLPKMTINPLFLRKKKDDPDRVKTMGDYVNGRKMEQVRESCLAVHVEYVDRFNGLANKLDELVLQSDAESRGFDMRAKEVGDEFAEGLGRLELALGQLPQLLESGSEDVDQDFIELDQAMRDDLIALTSIKNDFTYDIHLHLRQVANFQSTMHGLMDPIRKFEGDLTDNKERSAFPHLHRLHHIPFAYATALAEVVRRRDYGQMLVEWVKRLKSTLAEFTSGEEKRREQVQKELLSQLPFGLTMLEGAGPKVAVEVTTGAEGLSAVNFGYEEVEKLVQWLDDLKHDPDVIAAMAEGDENHLASLQASIEALVNKPDTAADDLDRLIERGVFHPKSQSRSLSNSRTMLHLSSQLRNVTQEKNEYERRLAELETTHAEHVHQLEADHSQRAANLQTRQAELQDELVRLRTDLSDEMVARQALSAELEVRLRDQEEKNHEVEDQAEMVAGLQAEVAQEKDRATDLGVRLQEALLDVDGLKSAEQALIGQLQDLQDERKRALEDQGEAQLTVQSLESQLAGLRAELDATAEQLATAQADRDTALKNQSAEAERLMRDHIAEADGDRAVLEHQNLTLTKQLEDLKLEMNEKLMSARNASIRQADGLKAELSFTKAQLREAQRKETVMADELAMAKDSVTSMVQEKTHQTDVARDAVALATRYHDACQRLLNAINASTTISGTNNQTRSRSPPAAIPGGLGLTTHPAASAHSSASRDEMRESVLVRSLATAQEFDLVGFTEAVTKTIGLVKKWSKSCRQFRDLARNKISFTNFVKGDLALFLPTRNAAARSWAAFNISAPHNFLKVTDAMQEQIRTREWIIARIVKTDEAVASGGDSPETNPFGLADGLRYYTHHVEEYNPATARVSSRRSTSASFAHSTERDGSASAMLASAHRAGGPGGGGGGMETGSTVLGGMMTPMTGLGLGSTPGVGVGVKPVHGRAQSGYFPPMSSLEEGERGESTPSPDPEPGSQADNSNTHTTSTSANPSPPKISSPPPVLSPTGTANPVPAPLTSPSTPQIRPPSHLHSRIPSRSSLTTLQTPHPASPGSRDHPLTHPPYGQNPLNHPARPSSVASSSSSYPRGLGGPGKGSLAPAMAVTTSSGGQDAEAGGAGVVVADERRASGLSSPPVGPTSPKPKSRRGSSTRERERDRDRDRRRPSAVSTSIPSGFGALGLGSPPAVSPSPGSSGGAGGAAGNKVLGFSIGRRRQSSGLSGGERPSAVDLLKKIDGGGAGGGAGDS
ncbi:hypothetical protein IAT38_006007 [Cryptococcus sp. DSM 104549]